MTVADCTHGDVVAITRGDQKLTVRLAIPLQFGGWLGRPVTLEPYHEDEPSEFVHAAEPCEMVLAQSKRNERFAAADRSAVRDYVMQFDEAENTEADEEVRV